MAKELEGVEEGLKAKKTPRLTQSNTQKSTKLENAWP